MSADIKTLQVYDERALEYANVTAPHAQTPQLADFIAAIPNGGRVLDLGCGPGHFAKIMLDAGLTVDATDASAQMVALTQRYPGINAHQESFDDLNAKSLYDGIWANFSLLHAPHETMPDLLSRIRDALKPSGQFHMAIKTGTGQARDRLGRFYAYYSKAEIRDLLCKSGFTITKITPGRDKGLDGTLSDWISVASHA